MRPQDIKINEVYRLRTSLDFGYVKVIKKLKAKEDENENSYAIVKCEHSEYINDKIVFTKYFRPCDLIKLTL